MFLIFVPNVLSSIYFFYRKIKPSHKVALLLDYDGTLTPLVSHPDLAILSKKTKDLLKKLSNLSNIHVSIVSGRDVNNLKNVVRVEIWS